MNFLLPLIVAALRAAFGYFRNAVEDGELEPLEMRKLMLTFVVTLGLSVALHYGLAVGEVEAASIVASVSMMWSEIKKEKTKL